MTRRSGFRKVIYPVLIFIIALSGFAQMPIFKRYYISDIPGFGWLAQFYVTHLIHYAGAFILIFLFFYYGVGFLLRGLQEGRKLSAAGVIHVFLLIALIITGALMVVKNLQGVYWPHSVIILLDVAHLGACMLLIGLSMYSLIRRRPLVVLQPDRFSGHRING